jgi:NAD(P)-dependent dehydrogenase (short-subunit alcohol dehydrogenase family)
MSSGAVVVITGGSSGIGLATARLLAQRGARLVLAARGPERLAEAAAQCTALGAEVLTVPTDVSDPEQVERLAGAAVERFGRIDGWANVAGTSLWGPFEEIPVATQRRLVEVDLLGVLHGCAAAVPRMLAQGGPAVIVNVGSIAGRVPAPWAASYTAAKYGVAGLTEALRHELGVRSRIAVCAVHPPFTDTPTARASGNHTGRTLRPLPPVVPPERVAARVAGLLAEPRRSVRPGLQNVLAAAYPLAPHHVGRLTARVLGHHLLRAGEPAPPTDGALSTASPGPALVRGDWGGPGRRRARVVAGAAGLAAATAWTGIRRGRRQRPG